MRLALTLVSCLAVAACGTKDDDTADTALPLITGTASGTTTPTSGPLTGAPTGPTTGTVSASLAIAGTWSDTWGTEHVIDDTSWSMGFPGYSPDRFAISQFSNVDQHLIAQNDAANSFYPSLWSRMDWHVNAMTGQVYFCQTGYDRPTEDDALALAEADATDLAAGCGGFPWTELLP